MKTLITILIVTALLLASSLDLQAGCRTRTVTRGCPPHDHNGGGTGDLSSLIAMIQLLREGGIGGNLPQPPAQEQVIQTLTPLLSDILQESAKAALAGQVLVAGQQSLQQGQQAILQHVAQGQQAMQQQIAQGQHSMLQGLLIMNQLRGHGGAATQQQPPQILLTPIGGSVAYRIPNTTRIAVPSSYLPTVRRYANLQQVKVHGQVSYKITSVKPELFKAATPKPKPKYNAYQLNVMRYTGGSLTRYPKKLW